MPIVQNLASEEGRNFYGLDASLFNRVDWYQWRVRDGDEASCLNLNRAQQPRLLGVNPLELDRRHSFTFAEMSKSVSKDHPWLSLSSSNAAIPAIADAASAKWAAG